MLKHYYKRQALNSLTQMRRCMDTAVKYSHLPEWHHWWVGRVVFWRNQAVRDAERARGERL